MKPGMEQVRKTYLGNGRVRYDWIRWAETGAIQAWGGFDPHGLRPLDMEAASAEDGAGTDGALVMADQWAGWAEAQEVAQIKAHERALKAYEQGKADRAMLDASRKRWGQ